MRFVRFLLTALLCLGVAIQGYASTRVMDADCPMMHTAVAPQADPATASAHDMHQMAGMDHMAGMEHAAGVDPQPPCHTGQPAADDHGIDHHCACIVGCHSAGTLPMGASSGAGLAPGTPNRLPLVAASFHSHNVFRHWRPPASI